MANAPLIDHLVLIAGLKGAGKTTFFNLLAAGDVEPEIVEMIFGKRSPDVYALQPMLMEKQYSRDELGEMGRLLIVQANPRIAMKGGYGTFEKVPFFDIFNHAKHVTVVTVQPEAEKLAEQWWKRRVETARKTSMIRPILVQINYYLQPFLFWKKFRNKHTTKILYRFPAEINKIYHEWRAFMRRSATQDMPINLVDITTVGEKPGPGSFVLDTRHQD